MTAVVDTATRSAATGIARIGVGLCLLGLAAAILVTGGGAGLAGALGSLFGLGGGHSGSATPTAAVAHARPGATAPAPRVVRAVQAPAQAQRRHAAAHHHDTATAPPRAPRGGTPGPAPSRPPGPAPAPQKQPSPAPQQHAVDRTVDAIRQGGRSLPAPAQPAVDQVASTVGSACALIGGCP